MKKSDDARWISLWIFFLVFCSVSIFFSSIGFAQQQTKILKIAVLDSPNMPKKLSLWKRYEQAYLAGIETSVLAAKEQGITLQYKTFFYGEKPLDILKKIPLVQAWHPDVILGPHYSNQLFLLKDYFTDTLVLSSYASDPSIKELPNNFYSIFPSDNDLMEVIMHFIQQRFGSKNILMLVQSDCKECTNMADNFTPSYTKKSKKLSSTPSVTRRDFIGESVNEVSLSHLVQSYQKNDIILIFTANYYLYEMLLGRLVNFIKKPHLIFITDVDHWGIQGINLNSTMTEKALNYQAYRVTPLFSSLSSTGNELLEFNRLFLKRYKTPTADSVSYVTFLTIKSVLAALEKFPTKNTTLPVSKQVLISYEQAVKTLPGWYHSNKYAVYQYTGKKEVLVDKIMLNKSISHSGGNSHW